MPSSVDLESTIDDAWERTFGESPAIGAPARERGDGFGRPAVAGCEEDDLGMDDRTVLAPRETEAPRRSTRADLSEVAMSEAAMSALRRPVTAGGSGPTAVADAGEIGAAMEVSPRAPLRYVCWVDHVESRDRFMVAAPTMAEFHRVVMERRQQLRLLGQPTLIWVPMHAGKET